MNIAVEIDDTIKTYVLVYDHNWGARYPRRVTRIYFPFRPSKALLDKLFKGKKWDSDPKYWSLTKIQFGKEYKLLIGE